LFEINTEHINALYSLQMIGHAIFCKQYLEKQVFYVTLPLLEEFYYAEQ
jgi:hypothetical protein